jgi:RNA polymerase sigma-70 factor, ECF subfamily
MTGREGACAPGCWGSCTTARSISSAGTRYALRDVSDDEALEAQRAPGSPARDVGRRDDAAAIRIALSDLPDDQRHVIVLAYFGGYSHTEIAAMLRIPTGTVKGRMRLGMSKLRLSLGALAEVES